VYIHAYLCRHIYIHTYIYTYIARSLKDLAYAGLNTSNWAGLAADRRAWWRTLNNLGTNGAKLIADACDAAALSASRIAVADTEVARIVALEQVEAATRVSTAAAAAAPTWTEASWEGKRKGGGGWGVGKGGFVWKCLLSPWLHECAVSAQAKSRWLKTTPPSARGELQTIIEHTCICASLHTYIYECVYTYIHTCIFLLSGYVLTHLTVPTLANILLCTHAYTCIHTHTVPHVTHTHNTIVVDTFSEERHSVAQSLQPLQEM